MSVILMACKNRDMSKKRKVIRKAGALLGKGSRVKLTTGWEVEINSCRFKISFSRDNLHVWVDGEPVETTAYISDAGYDVDLFFNINCQEGHIFSDVDNDRNEMVNYLFINKECVAKCYQAHQA